MGNNLFGADISSKIARALGGRLLSGALTSYSPGARTPSSLASGTNPSKTEHTFRGIRIGKVGVQKGTLLPQTKDAVLILGGTISPPVVPSENDRITIEGRVFVVVGVERDPDAASYTCQVR